MKKSKKGVGTASKVPQGQWKSVARAEASEVAASPRIIGYTLWDKQSQGLITEDGAVLTFGSEYIAEDIVSSMNCQSRLEIRETKCSDVHRGLVNGEVFLLLPDKSTGYGEMKLSDVISFFGDVMFPSTASPAGIVLDSGRPSEVGQAFVFRVPRAIAA